MPRLHLAAADGNIEQGLSYLMEGDDINDMTESVTHGGQVWTPDCHGQAGRKMTPLHLAAYNGHTDMVSILAEAGALLDKRDAWRDVPGQTALEMAICRKNFTTAIHLRQLGAKIGVEALEIALSQRDIRNELMDAAIYKKPQNIYAIYTEGRLEKEAAEYALRLAAEYGTLSIINALLDCGVDVNACDPNALTWFNSKQHKTPLGIAAEHGHEEAVLLLLERGAEVDKPTHVNPNQTTNTPLREAMCHLGFKESNPKLFEILLSHGADFKQVDDIAWRFFAEKGSVEEMGVFLKYGLDPNMQYENQPYLRHCIIAHRSSAIPLIMAGADVHYIDEQGRNYLHHSRSPELTQLLLGRALNPTLTDKNGKTPIQYVDKNSAELLADISHDGPKEINHLSLHDHRVLSSSKLFRQLIVETHANVNAVDEKGISVLRKLAHSALLDGYLENLIWLLDNTTVNVNQASLNGGWTALHEAFSQIQGFVNMDFSDEDVARNKYAQAIDALIAHGAKPTPDKQGRTPLMCLTHNGFSCTFNHAAITRYHRFEACHYGVDAAFYKTQFYTVRNNGFNTIGGLGRLPIISLYEFSVPIPKNMAAFWEILEEEKQLKIEQEAQATALPDTGRRRLSLFAMRDARFYFPVSRFLDKFEATEKVIRGGVAFHDIYGSCRIEFSETTDPEVLKKLVEKMKQQGLKAEYEPSYRHQFIHRGPCIEIRENKATLEAFIEGDLLLTMG